MKYIELHDLVLSEAEIYIPMGFSAIKTMVWITEAIHQYQVRTGVARCIQDLILDPTSLDGKYELDSDIDTIEKIDYFANETSIPLPVNMYDYAGFFRLQAQGNAGVLPANTSFTVMQAAPMSGNTETNSILPGSLPSFYYATRYSCNLYFMPVSTGGFLRIYYKPYLTAYTPSAEGRWKKFGKEPSAAMRTEDIPREFQAALEGIKGYVMAKVLQKIPNHTKIFPGAWQGYSNDFHAGFEALLLHSPNFGQSQPPTPNMTGRLI